MSTSSASRPPRCPCAASVLVTRATRSAPTIGLRAAVTRPPPSEVKTTSGCRSSTSAGDVALARGAAERETTSRCCSGVAGKRGRRASTALRARDACWRAAAGVVSQRRRDLVERVAEDVVQDERDPLVRRQALEHDEQRERDVLGLQRALLRARARLLARSARAATGRRRPRAARAPSAARPAPAATPSSSASPAGRGSRPHRRAAAAATRPARHPRPRRRCRGGRRRAAAAAAARLETLGERLGGHDASQRRR